MARKSPPMKIKVKGQVYVLAGPVVNLPLTAKALQSLIAKANFKMNGYARTYFEGFTTAEEEYGEEGLLTQILYFLNNVRAVTPEQKELKKGLEKLSRRKPAPKKMLGGTRRVQAAKPTPKDYTEDLHKILDKGVKHFIANAKVNALWEAADKCSAQYYSLLSDAFGEPEAKKIIKEVFAKLGADGQIHHAMTEMIFKGHNSHTGY